MSMQPGASSPSETEGAPAPAPMPKAVLCPYCGHLSMNTQRCDSCRGYVDPLSRQASQNSMGPWFIRDEQSPFRPGCSYETLCAMVRRGRVRPETVLRGPSTRQFWTYARSTPGVAHLLGVCYACRAPAAADDPACRSCGASFTYESDRQLLGLAPVHLLPGHAAPEIIAAASVPGGMQAPVYAGPGMSQTTPEMGGAVFGGVRGDVPTPALDRVRAGSSRRRGGGGRDGLVLALAVFSALLAAVLALILLGPAMGVRVRILDDLVGRGERAGVAPATQQEAAAPSVAPATAEPAMPIPSEPATAGEPQPETDASAEEGDDEVGLSPTTASPQSAIAAARRRLLAGNEAALIDEMARGGEGMGADASGDWSEIGAVLRARRAHRDLAELF